MPINYKPTLQTLERLVGAGLSDAAIALELTAGTRTERWARKQRIRHGVRRRQGGAGRNAECIVDDPFYDPEDRADWYERYRHGEVVLDEIAVYCGVSLPEIYHDWLAYYAEAHADTMETPAARRARRALSDSSVDVLSKCQSVFGSRLKTIPHHGHARLLLDGARITLSALVDAADEECADLGLPPIGRVNDDV